MVQNETYKEDLPMVMPLVYKINVSQLFIISSKSDEPVFVFDVDDTLYSFKDELIEVYLEHLLSFSKSKGIVENTGEIVKSYYLKYGHGCVGLMKYHDVQPKEFLNFVDKKTFENYNPTINEDLIELLSKIPFKKYCFSNGGHSSVLKVLTELKIAHFFEGVICPDYEDGTFINKPFNEAYDFVEAVINTHSKNVYFFDDNVRNVAKAKEKGWNAWCVNNVNLKDGVNEALKILDVLS